MTDSGILPHPREMSILFSKKCPKDCTEAEKPHFEVDRAGFETDIRQKVIVDIGSGQYR